VKIKRLHLKNYRGTAERTLQFPDHGVIIVEGPNEVGKSSLAEALDLLFAELDSTTKRSVKDIRPVDRDVSTEIEAEIETGGYVFTYTKRFFKERGTLLRVTKPKPENLTGREAHDRARAILRETIDEHLWRSLRVQQGAAVEQARGLGQAPSLAEALDRTAGREMAGDREVHLFDRVRDEYAYYFTETGLRRKQMVAILEADEHADAEVERLRGELARLEEDVERSEELRVESERIEHDRKQAQAAVTRLDQDLRTLEERSGLVDRLAMTRKSARLSETVARNDLERRTALVTGLDETQRARVRLEELATAEEPALSAAEEHVTKARAALDSAETRAKQAGELLRLRDHDVKYHHARLDLEQLVERRGRIDEAQARAAEAHARLEQIKITDEAFKRIRELYFALERVQAQVDARSPQLRVEALGAVDLELDGEHSTLEPGTTVEHIIAGTTRLLVPGVIEITLRAGAGVDELADERDRTKQELDKLLSDAVVHDLEKAEAENEARKDALRTLEETERQIRQDLRDLTCETLEAKILRLQKWDSYPGERVAEPPLAADYDAARTAQHDCRTAEELAVAEGVAARTALASLDLAAQELRHKVRTAHAELQFAAKAERKAQLDLDAARRDGPDTELEQRFVTAEDNAREAESKHAAAVRALEARHPGRIREEAAMARKLAADLAVSLRNVHKERHGLEAVLEARNREGLYDALEEALTRREHARQQRAGMEQRAGAARILFETMRAEREHAQLSYQGPLRDGIMRFGRPVFGASFSVELDDDLRIATRTLDDKTLPFSSLSVGAQEQLALIARVACALVVDAAEGVPLIFDDTLGHSDPERLAGMGAMLGRAGERCQIIVLTCTPDRYRAVPGAHTIKL